MSQGGSLACAVAGLAGAGRDHGRAARLHVGDPVVAPGRAGPADIPGALRRRTLAREPARRVDRARRIERRAQLRGHVARDRQRGLGRGRRVRSELGEIDDAVAAVAVARRRQDRVQRQHLRRAGCAVVALAPDLDDHHRRVRAPRLRHHRRGVARHRPSLACDRGTRLTIARGIGISRLAGAPHRPPMA
ncbi:MAG: hypothetical protein K8W52_11985 [Deltaproteobacteria bacterium]|nr:hypothetical protein [Deltaproteobacteria bacterium]